MTVLQVSGNKFRKFQVFLGKTFLCILSDGEENVDHDNL